MGKSELLTRENFSDYADIQGTKRPLTEEELASTDYAKFYEFPVTDPTDEQIEALAPGHEMPVELSMTPADYGKMFHPEEHLVENGFCVRPEGYGCIAVDVKFPGVSWDMIRWFMGWYTSNPVHYMTWLPRFHVISNSEIVQEDLGWGDVYSDKMAGPPFLAEQFGVKDPKEIDPDFVTMFGGAMHLWDPADTAKEHPIKLTMVNYIRRCGDGIEDRIRTWMGIHYIDGQIVHDDGSSPVSLYDRTRWIACHNAWEWTRASTLLPAIYQYAKETGKPTAPPSGPFGGPGPKRS